jgi:hypothetical protein
LGVSFDLKAILIEFDLTIAKQQFYKVFEPFGLINLKDTLLSEYFEDDVRSIGGCVGVSRIVAISTST